MNKLLENLIAFTSVDGLNIKGLSPNICNKLIFDTDMVKDLADVFNLTADVLLEYGVVKNKATALLIESSISKATYSDMGSVLKSLNIDSLTEEYIDKLVNYRHSPFSLMDYDIVDWTKITNNETHAKAIYDWFSFNKETYTKFLNVMIFPEKKPAGETSYLKNQRWLITGGIETCTRSELIDMLIINGAKVLEDFNESVTHCLVGKTPDHHLVRKCTSYGVMLVDYGSTLIKGLSKPKSNTGF